MSNIVIRIISKGYFAYESLMTLTTEYNKGIIDFA